MSQEALLVIGAAIFNFLLGGVWYGIFKKKWMLAWALSEEDLSGKDPKPYLIAFIGSLWASYGMFLILKHIQPKDFSELIAVCFGLWLFIFVGMGAKHYAFAKRSLNAFIIDYALDLLGFIAMGFIIWENY